MPLQPAQDFKRVGDDDAGPNTGGMGAYSPLEWAPADLVDEVVRTVAQPTIDEMAQRGTPFAGVLYVGLALTSKGPKVVEFNARFGDPETQVVLARLVTPLGQLLRAAARGELVDFPALQWRNEAAVTVVVASDGYPAQPKTGDPISGLEDVDGDGSRAGGGAYVLHAGTKAGDDGTLVSSGGRVLSVVAALAAVEDAISHRLARIDAVREARARGVLTMPRLLREIYGPDLPAELEEGATWNILAATEHIRRTG